MTVPLTLREEKGAELTWAELDGNFTALRAAATQTYDTVAEMKLGTHAAGQIVRCRRHGATGPIIGSLYYISKGAGWPVTADGYVDHADAGGNYLELLSSSISPEQAGAVCDGIANDLSSCQRAANYCAANKKSLVFNSPFTYGINGYILVKNGTPSVRGLGGKIKYIGGASYSGVMLAGRNNGQSANVKYCTVENLHIDCNLQNGTGIFCENISFCKIKNNTILNVANGYGILSRAFDAGLEDAIRNEITGNNITLIDTDSDLVYGIELSSPFPYADPVANWKSNFADVQTTYINAFSTVSNNIVYGGYYGLSFNWSRYCIVSGNQTTRNVRGMSVQHLCIGNKLSGNEIIDCLSSGITLGYNSNYNTVSTNKVYSSRSTQQALLNCYVGCDGNTFSNNDLYCSAGAGPQWYMYCAINSNQNVFEDNTIKGPCQKAYMAIESAWNNAVTNPAHYAYGLGTDVNGFANAASAGNALIGNKVFGSSAIPAIFLAQIADASARALQRTIVKGNIIYSGIHNYQLELYEQNSGQLQNGNLSDNDFYFSLSSSNFVLPRGRLHFAIYKGNSWLNDTTFIDPPTNNDGFPSVGLRSRISLSGYTILTDVQDFINGVEGQDIVIKLGVNAKLKHNAASLRLKGGVDVTAADSNAIIGFTRNAGIWFETSRNF